VLTDEEIGDLRAIVREARDKVVCLFLPSWYFFLIFSESRKMPWRKA
jgi:hypothetical protein